MNKHLLLLAIAMVCLQVEVLAEDATVMRGIRSLMVEVTLSGTCLEFGVSQFDIQNTVELELRRTGIRVKSELRKEDMPDALLEVWIFSVGEKERGASAIAVRLWLVDLVSLVRNPKIMCGAKTWEAEMVVGLVSSDSDRASSVKTHLKGLIDEFLNKYLSDNS